MNATNPFYQALSFYKVTEGVAAERKRRAQGAKGTWAELNSAEEKFPHSLDELKNVDPHELEFFQDYLGITFETARTRMSAVIRHASAHLAKFDEVLDADTFDDQEKCNAAIPVLRYMASAMIKNDLQTIAPI
jgi:Methylamine utilization protein MauJ